MNEENYCEIKSSMYNENYVNYLQRQIDELQQENQQLKKEIDKLTAESTEFESKYYQSQETKEKIIEYIKQLPIKPIEVQIIKKIIEGENNESIK